MNAQPPKPGPLEGYRVIDMTSVIAGPYATQIIADLGADVIKVEGAEGDLMRTAGPYRQHRDMATLYMGLNRNKRALALDLKLESAKQAGGKLTHRAAVFVPHT